MKLDEKPSSGNRIVFHAGRRTARGTGKKTKDRQTDKAKLAVAFRNFANAPEDRRMGLSATHDDYKWCLCVCVCVCVCVLAR